MATAPVQERLAVLEVEVAQLKARLEGEQLKNKMPWWERRFGAFEDDPEYDESLRLGREYRESLRPKDDEDVA